MQLFVLAMVAAWSMTVTAASAIIHVDAAAAGGAADGSSWRNAYVDLQDALAAAQAGDEIRVAQGTYTPAPRGGDRAATFTLIDGVILRGGYAGAGAANPDEQNPRRYRTTLSGDLNGDDGPDYVNRQENSLHVVTVTATGASIGATLSGLTVRSGEARVEPSCDVTDAACRGGGILLHDGVVLTIASCVIDLNRAHYYGGGIAEEHNASATLILQNTRVRRNRCTSFYPSAAAGVGVSNATIADSVFADNRGGYSSGALGVANGAVIERCLFLNNQASEDGAVIGMRADFVFRDCRFIGNSSGYYGSLQLRDAATATFENCEFRDNGGSYGGVIAVNDATASIHVLNCRFVGNSASSAGAISNHGIAMVQNCAFLGNFTNWNNGYHGGAIASSGELTLVNCLFAGNAAGYWAGAIYTTGNTTIRSCTVVGNREHLGTSGAVHHNGGPLTIENSILWSNTAGNSTIEGQQLHSLAPAALTIRNSIIEGWSGALGGIGNTGDDPMFLDADGDDDIFGTEDDNPRLTMDSPARDTGDNAALPSDTHDLDEDGDVAEPIPVDLDFRRRVVNGTVDLGAFEHQTCPADIAPLASQGDGLVNVRDLLALIDSWGPCAAACPGDIAPMNSGGDGRVDLPDLLLLLGSWGRCQ